MTKEPDKHEPVDQVDIEEFSKNNSGSAPKAKRYIIKVGKEKYPTEKSVLTGKEILQLAGKMPPAEYLLNQRFKGGRTEPVALDQEVDLTAPGVERFTVIKKDQTEGGL